MAAREEIISRFTGPMGQILEEELQLGNGIFDTWEGDFPYPDHSCICLTHPFKTPVRHNWEGLEYFIPTEHFNWKEEYIDPKRKLVLCCMFDVVFGSW